MRLSWILTSFSINFPYYFAFSSFNSGQFGWSVFTDHDIFQFCYFFRILVRIYCAVPTGRTPSYTVHNRACRRGYSCVTNFHRSFAYGLATVQFLEFEIEEFMFLLSLPVFQEGKHADAVHFLLLGFRMDDFFEGR